MRYYHCQCGKREFWGSDTPALCIVCDECGTTLLKNQDGEYRKSKPHKFQTLYDRNTGKPYQWCSGCGDRQESYDCTENVLAHKKVVSNILKVFINELISRSAHHDESKLSDPEEKALFDRWTPELRRVTFGTDEYKMSLEGMGEGVKRHYRANRHHPEHFENGVNGMTLIDVIEMVADWIAAAEARNMSVDLQYGAERFGLSEQLARIIANTIQEAR